ncbi:chemotaxis protein CheA [bacterium]|nr:chemotaxis protein CheA [bacterium]
MADDLNDMIQGFVEESHEAFDDIENDLLTIESNPEDLSIVNGIFRVMHTIKGTAGFLNLDDIGKLAHKIESIFDMIRREELKITSDIMDTLLPSIDLLKLMVFELIESKKSQYNLEETLSALQILTRVSAAAGEKKEEPNPFFNLDSSDERRTETSRQKSIRDKHLLQFREDIVSVSQQLKSDFVIEAEEHLEIIEANLLILEQNPEDKNSINEVFRAIHSIKGTSDYVNLATITEISHKLETIFDQIRKDSQKYNNEIADVVLKGIDILKTLIFMLKTDDTSAEIRIGEIIEQLEKLIILKKQPLTIKVEPKEALPSSINAFKNISSQQILVVQHLGNSFLNDILEPEELMVLLRSVKTLRDGARRVGLNKVVSQSLHLENMISAVSSGRTGIEEIRETFQNLSDDLISEVNRIIDTPEDEILKLIATYSSKTDTLNPAVPEKLSGQDKSSDSTATQPLIKDSTIKTMRVDSSRLDTFMNLIGELIITRNSFSHTISEMNEQKVPENIILELKSMEANFNRISEDLQATLMDIRLLPVKSVFQKIPRIIRDIARRKDKKIQFQIIGENTEIDKSIIEMIGDPLVHIVRNCCDHGIESIEERKKLGKPETGNIILRASHLGSAIAIDVIDDGAGIDTDKVRQIAIERGMLSREKAESLDKKAINSYIFQPGFSTADEVTDISGRGVGMDVVITNIKKIHGSVDVESDKGQGTQVRLLLPLTLAVVDALLVLDNNQKYAIPLETVKETIEIREEELQTLKNNEAINLRGDIIGITRLSNLLGMPQKPYDPEYVLSVVFLQAGTRIIGIVVDDLSNQQEIVVKPLQKYLSNIPGISGSTILGNGEIILILDPAELIDIASM